MPKRRHAGLCRAHLAFGRTDVEKCGHDGSRGENHQTSVACGANMDSRNFKNSLWFRRKCVSIEAPEEGMSTCRSKRPKGEAIERTYDHVLASRILQRKIKNMEVVEDFESRPHKAVTFLWKETRRFGNCVS